jgi:hypothetical protein
LRINKSIFIILIGSICLSIDSCRLVESNFEKKIGTGIVSIKKIKRFNWFKEAYLSYHPNTKVIDSIKLYKEFKINIIGGVWCSDTRTQLPRFIKMSEAINFPLNDIKVILVDREKTCKNCGDYSKEKYKLLWVPTFIIQDKDKLEIGRIIESPKVSLESDLLKILVNHYR